MTSTILDVLFGGICMKDPVAERFILKEKYRVGVGSIKGGAAKKGGKS